MEHQHFIQVEVVDLDHIVVVEALDLEQMVAVLETVRLLLDMVAAAVLHSTTQQLEVDFRE
jgi:hypothetical protein